MKLAMPRVASIQAQSARRSRECRRACSCAELGREEELYISRERASSELVSGIHIKRPRIDEPRPCIDKHRSRLAYSNQPQTKRLSTRGQGWNVTWEMRPGRNQPPGKCGRRRRKNERA